MITSSWSPAVLRGARDLVDGLMEEQDLERQRADAIEAELEERADEDARENSMTVEPDWDEAFIAILEAEAEARDADLESSSRGSGGSADVSRRVVLTPASKIRMRPVQWLWNTTPQGAEPTSQGRVPMDSLAIAAGGPGLGKSQFAVWMAARITTGTLPGQLKGSPRSVIYAASEDSWSYTIAPRLVAAGANLDWVFRVDVEDDGHPHARLTLPTDISLLGNAAEEYSVALVVADPLLSLIDDSINDYRAAEVRSALEPLATAAEKHRFTVLGLAHFTKSGTADPLARISGSGAFGQIIRSALVFARCEDDDVGFVMSQAKNNLGRLDVPSYAYSIEPVTVETDDGPTYVSRFVLGAETTGSVKDVLREETSPDRGATGDAVAWLKGYLTDMGGEADMQNIKKIAKDAGFSESVIDRAKTKAGIGHRGSGFGAARRSIWYLSEA